MIRIEKEYILSEIDNLRKHNNLIIVEGKNDLKALNELGLKRVFTLHQTQISLFSSIDRIINELKTRESCVILTDLDKKGKYYYKLIKKELTFRRIKTNNRLREILFKTRLSHIEGLTTYLKNNLNNSKHFL